MAIGMMIASIAIGLNQVMQAIMHYYPPLWQYTQQSAFKSWPNTIPTPDQLVDIFYKELIDETTYYDKMSEYGFDEKQATFLYDINRNLLSATDYITLNRRGLLDEEKMVEELTRLHFTTEQITELQNASLYFPSPPDLVRFAVREVYTPAIVEAYGLMEDIPEKYLQEALKAGLPEEQAKNFWASHWELPSTTQGYEMFHRRVINKDELTTLMRAKDIMPNWRDKLIQISYNPLTRVDVRRMYNMGVLNEEEVYNAYLDVGYSPENATRMTEFTKQYYEDDLKGISRANVVSAFKDDLLSELEFKQYLTDFGYSESVIQFWLNTTKYEKQNILINDFVSELKDQFVLGMKTKEEVLSALQSIQVNQNLLDSISVDLDLLVSKRTKLPTRQDLETWLKQLVIDEKQFSDKMKDLGYKENDVLYFLSSISKEVDTEKVKFLTDTVYTRWLKSGIMTTQQFRETMEAKGVRKSDIDKFVKENRSS